MQTDEAVDLFLTSRFTRNCANRTLKWYRIILEKYQATYPEIPETIEPIEKFIRDTPGKDERRHGYFRALRAFYRFLSRRYDIPNPIPKMDPPRRRRKLPKSLSLENFVRLMHYNHPPDIQAYLEFIADTGCRVGELCNIKPEDFEHGQDGCIVLLDGKTGERYVPVSDRTYQTVLPHIPIHYKVDWMTRRISRAFKDAGVRGTAHSLRHTFCSLWDGSEEALRQITGHCDMNTLGIYRHLKMHQLSVQHRQFTPLNLLHMDDVKTGRNA